VGGKPTVPQCVRNKCPGSRKTASKNLKTKYLEITGDDSVEYVAVSTGKYRRYIGLNLIST